MADCHSMSLDLYLETGITNETIKHLADVTVITVNCVDTVHEFQTQIGARMIRTVSFFLFRHLWCPDAGARRRDSKSCRSRD